MTEIRLFEDLMDDMYYKLNIKDHTGLLENLSMLGVGEMRLNTGKIESYKVMLLMVRILHLIIKAM
jgi:hypothetical protein